MIIKKIFNNNVLLGEDENKNEVVLIGNGIAFHKKIGNQVDISKIQKKFVFDTTDLNEKFKQLFEEIPIQYVELCSEIVDMAQKELEVQFDSNIYIALSDHIAYAIRRYEDNQVLKNALLFEIRKFYPREYKVALKALKYIFHDTGIYMEEDEAGYIAMHFVNAQQNGEQMDQTIKVTKIVDDILHIVEYHYQIKLDENSLNYTRFVTHIRYFARRLFTEGMSHQTDDTLYEQIRNRYPDANQCTLKVKRYIEENYNVSITKDEMTFFMLHINRVCVRDR
ncbi:BglG family transcription antiterminator LicT [Faecalicoccus pleomorphus]|uniref:BglG family transcription antiterminator LicT n=1 Tax=Faecalicoccus pleomorphus TaxID=1323 RepID=UPI00242CCA73|nr:PRD domain-containing protein [Faecalicoccus pleomorphus]